MKVIFLGNNKFSCEVLNTLVKSNHSVAAVVCSADKPSGRGNKLVSPEIKTLADRLGIPVFQFQSISKQGVEVLKKIDADIMVTASYGQMLSSEVIDICKFKVVNVHGSLLPKYRGATPIQSSIMNGDTFTGITIMNTELAMDTGAMIAKAQVEIDSNDTFYSLSEKMSIVGGDLLVETLNKIENGTAVYESQNDSEATYTKMIKKGDRLLDFNLQAICLRNKIRAYNDNPLTYFCIGSDMFIVYSATVVEGEFDGKNGQVLIANNKQGLVIKCGENALAINVFKASGGKMMDTKSYLNGKKIEEGIIVNG